MDKNDLKMALKCFKNEFVVCVISDRTLYYGKIILDPAYGFLSCAAMWCVNCTSAAAAAAAETTAGEVQQRREGEETLHQCNQFIFCTSNSQACHKVSHVEHNWAILGRRGGLASAQAAQCELSGRK